MDDSRHAAYARLAVLTGAGLQPGQELLVHAGLEHAPLVRAIAAEAYHAGARYVDVQYADPWVRRALVDGAPEDSLGWTPPWMVERLERAVREGAPCSRSPAPRTRRCSRAPIRRGWRRRARASSTAPGATR